MAGEKILVVDDEQSMTQFLGIVLRKDGFQVTTVNSGRDALDKIRTEAFDVVLSDIKMPGLDGIQLLQVFKMVDKVADSEATILIQGDSGTGKELIAREIHYRSRRNSGPFVSINCGAIPRDLLESNLFGHVKGSFTGAVKDSPGLFVVAEGGTFFLDEVGETPLATQVKLLRALQEREIIPVGGTQTIKIDCRLVAATNADLEREVAEGRFRADLFYRLNVIPI